MKKILCLFIAFVMSCSMLLGTCVYAQDNNNVIDRLSGLGIMQGDEGGFREDDTLTRAEFCQMVARLLRVENFSSGTMETGFSDVPTDHWASGCIIALNSMGLVSGNGDGTFSPDSEVLFDEAIKILVSAVEYQIEAESKGGYPQGYRATAAKLGITRSVEAGQDAITRMTAASLIYNTLDVVPLEKKYGTDEYQINHENLTLYEILLRQMESIEIEGVLMANEFIDLKDSTAQLESGYITLEVSKRSRLDVTPELVTYLSENAYSQYIGYYVRGYAKYIEAKGDYEIVTLSPVEKYNDMNLVDAADAKIADDYLEYWPDSKKALKKINFADDVIYVYNNRIISEPSQEEKKIYCGQYRLLDNTGDKRVDIVFIDEAESFIVNKVNENNKSVLFANKQTYRGKSSFAYEYDDADKKYEFVDKSGKPLQFGDIEAGQGITLMMSKDESYTKVMISDEQVSGRIDGIQSDENEIVIDGETYELTLNAQGKNEADLKLGDEGCFILDVFGKVIGVYGDKIANLSYGYVVGAADTGSFNSELQLRVITGTKPVKQEKVESGNTKISYFFQNDVIKEYKCSSKVKCYETSEVIDSSGRLAQSFNEAEASPAQLRDKLIGFSANSDGEINKIYMYAIKKNDSELGSSLFNGKICSFGGEGTGNVVGRGYATNDSTTFICIPSSVSPSDDDYSVQLEIKDGAGGNYVYGVKTFFVPTAGDLSVDEMREIQYAQPVDVLVIRAEMNAEDPAPVSQDADVCMVSDVAACLGEIGDDTGSRVYALELLNKDKKITEYTASSGKAFDVASGLMKGDLIQYTRDGFGRIARIEQVGHIQGLDNELTPDDTREHDYREEGNMLYGGVKNVERELYYYNYNEVVDMVTLELGDDVERYVRIPVEEGPPIYLYDRKTGWIYPASADDIEADGGSSVCAFMDTDNMVSAVVIVND